MRKWQAIVFDLDDTLYPEAQYVRSGFGQVARWSSARLTIPSDRSAAELNSLFESGVRGNIFDVWLQSHNCDDPRLVNELVRVYREHSPDIEPFEGISELLSLLKSEYRLGLLSDGYISVQRRKLQALRLAYHFQSIVFSDEWGRTAWKPNVRCFAAVAEMLGCAANRIVYVGDNPTKDFVGARRAGFASIWLRQKGLLYTHLEPETPEHVPDTTVCSVSGLQDALIDKF